MVFFGVKIKKSTILISALMKKLITKEILSLSHGVRLKAELNMSFSRKYKKSH